MSATSWFSQMVGMGLKLDNLKTLLVHQLQDLYSAEQQLIDALPKMEDAANDPDLKMAFRDHLEETRHQKVRLEKAFRMLGEEPGSETCDAMKGLISEGNEIISLEGDADVKDAALIAAAQRVEHYEIAGYGCVRTFARRLQLEDLATLLQVTLDEEANADKTLTAVAEASINRSAAHA